MKKEDSEVKTEKNQLSELLDISSAAEYWKNLEVETLPQGTRSKKTKKSTAKLRRVAEKKEKPE